MGTRRFTVGQTVWSLEDGIALVGWDSTAGAFRGRPLSPTAYTRYIAWTVDKETPKGVYISRGLPEDRLRGARMWVKDNTNKVSPTKEEARDCALRRRSWHVKQCEERLDAARARLYAIEDTEVPT